MKLLVQHVADRAGGGAIRRSKPRKAKTRAASIEPDSASLHQSRVANLPTKAKPVSGWVATSMCTRCTLRGGWGRRVSNEQPGTWEARPGASAGGDGKGECITFCR